MLICFQLSTRSCSSTYDSEMKIETTKIFQLIMMTLCMSHQVYSCAKKWQECGDTYCCCKHEIARCINKQLHYIPKLPNETTHLVFSLNDIKHVTKKTFENIRDIKKLAFVSNGVESIANDSFESFSDLQELNFTYNENINKSQLASSLYSIPKSVQVLSLDKNNLNSLPDDFFRGLTKAKVQTIFLKYNRLTIFNEIMFYYLPTLKTLNLGHNWIRNISVPENGKRIGSKTIENLGLSFNNFLQYPPWFCDGRSLYPNLKTLDLSGNTIIVPVRQAWSCLKTLRKLNLDRNVLQLIKNDTFLDLVSLEKLQVSYMVKPIHTIYPRAFHNTNLNHLHLDHNALVFKSTSDIPYGELFKFSPNLRKLHLGYNNFRNLSDIELVDMLSKLPKLEDLHMEGVHLRSIPETLLNYFNLTKLYLGNNELSSIDPVVYRNVTALKVLHLDANNIKVINETFPETLRLSLKEINLAGNPFSCSFCDPNNNIWFRNWIDKTNIKFVSWPNYYKCASPPKEAETRLVDHHPSSEDCKPTNPMIIAFATTGTFIFIFLMFSIAAFKGRWYIMYWRIKLLRYLRNCACGRTTDPERQRLLEDNVRYDAYVIYHEKDRTFVREELSRFMEKEHHYELFIWDREFEPGARVVDIMVENIYSSSHVIAVISKHFLKDPWCEFQLDVTIDRQIELKRKYLTLVTLGDVDKQLLSKSWCVLFTKTPTAEWSERKNDIRRKLFASQILTNVPCRARPTASRQTSSVNNESDLSSSY